MPTLTPTVDGKIWITLSTNGNYLPITANDSWKTYTYTVITGSGGSNVNGSVRARKTEDGIGDDDYIVESHRYLVEFDTSGFNRAPVSASLILYGLDNSNDANLICVESTFIANGSIAEADWSGHNESNPVTYTEKISGSAIKSGYVNSLNFTQDGLNAMGSRDRLQMACLEAEYDYNQVEPPVGTNSLSEWAQDEEPSGIYSSLQPYMTYWMGNDYKIESGKLKISSGKVTIT